MNHLFLIICSRNTDKSILLNIARLRAVVLKPSGAHAHIVNKALVEIWGISRGSLVVLVALRPFFCVMNLKRHLRGPTDLYFGLSKELL